MTPITILAKLHLAHHDLLDLTAEPVLSLHVEYEPHKIKNHEKIHFRSSCNNKSTRKIIFCSHQTREPENNRKTGGYKSYLDQMIGNSGIVKKYWD